MTKLIAFDLDNTLFNDKKEISSETLRVLTKAHNLGIEIVPATGRVWSSVPNTIKNLEFVNYAITLNGAEILDVKAGKIISEALMPVERGITLCRVFDDLGIVYDCLSEGKRFMTNYSYQRIDEISSGQWQADIIRQSALPVDDIYGELRNTKGIQKMQTYTLDQELRMNLLKSLPIVFPNALFTSSVINNIEINDPKADKGEALKFIAGYLNLPLSATMAFGDGLNDVNMIRSAGIGIAMKNSCEELLTIADHVTTDNNHDGVAEGIKTFCRGIDDDDE